MACPASAPACRSARGAAAVRFAPGWRCSRRSLGGSVGRNYRDVTDTIREFMRRGVVIRTVINNMVFDGATKDPMQQAVRDALIAFMAATAQAQAEATKEAQRAGILHAQENDDGTKFRGRKPSFNWDTFAAVQELLSQGIAVAEIAKIDRPKASNDLSDSERTRAAGDRTCCVGFKTRASGCESVMPSVVDFLRGFFPVRSREPSARPGADRAASIQTFQPVGLQDFLALEVPPREMLLAPILPERSLSMLYAPRGIGKSWLGLSIGLAVASGGSVLRWNAPRPRRVLFVDGEMVLSDLQVRLNSILAGLGTKIPNDGFRVLAADHTELGINLGSTEGQQALERHLDGVDLAHSRQSCPRCWQTEAKVQSMRGCPCRTGC